MRLLRPMSTLPSHALHLSVSLSSPLVVGRGESPRSESRP